MALSDPLELKDEEAKNFLRDMANPVLDPRREMTLKLAATLFPEK